MMKCYCMSITTDTVKGTDLLSALIPCWKNQPTAEKNNIKKKSFRNAVPMLTQIKYCNQKGLHFLILSTS